MTTTILRHSDQIVTAFAKIPVSTYGTHFTKDVALFLADHMNKAKDWSACLYLNTIAKAVGCTVRTVRNALRRLEGLGIIKTTHRKHDQIANWNLASVYKLGSAIISLFRTPGTGFPAKSLTSSKQKQSNSDHSRFTAAGQTVSCTVRTPDEWEVCKQEGIQHNKSALERIKAMFGRVNG